MRHDSKFGYLKYSTSAFKQISELFLQITDNFKKKVNCGNLDSIETGDGFRMQLSRQPSFWGEIHSQGELFGAMGSDIMMQEHEKALEGLRVLWASWSARTSTRISRPAPGSSPRSVCPAPHVRPRATPRAEDPESARSSLSSLYLRHLPQSFSMFVTTLLMMVSSTVLFYNQPFLGWQSRQSDNRVQRADLRGH